MFEVGDHIVYPMHGAGKIKAIEVKEVGGQKQPYYIINMIIGDMKVMIPEKKLSKTNIRPVKELDEIKEIAMNFEHEGLAEDMTWKQRQKINTEKVESGSLEACMEVIYSLLQLEEKGKLNSSERRLLNQAKEFLLSELKLVEGMDKDKKDKFMSMFTGDHLSVS